MASLQKKGNAWYCQFSHGGKRHTFTIGQVSAAEARQWAARADHFLMRLDQGLLQIPPGLSAADFIKNDGKPPPGAAQVRAAQTTFHDLREAYLATHSNGAVEKNTLATTRTHLNHIQETLSKSFVLSGLTLATLQKHVDRRQARGLSATTIKKELDTFRTAWNWGQRMGHVGGPFPGKGLAYRRTREKLPFMSRDEVERRIEAGGDADRLWECLYLDGAQVAEFLEFARKKRPGGWLYPMLVTAAHTGARRSEMMRARLEDVDLTNAVITLNEKKRAKDVNTTRRVPISTKLAEVLAPLVKAQEGKSYLFGDGTRELTRSQADGAFDRLVADSKWKNVRGFHTLRHAFVSALANRGVDQRVIDEFTGHVTDQQRKRYRHLFKQVTREAIASVFG